MKTRSRKLLAMLLSLAMCLSMIPAMAAVGDTYHLVKDASQLAAGDEVIIAALGSDAAMGAAKTSNFGQTAVTKEGESITLPAGVTTLTLEKGSKPDSFAFALEGRYLHASGGTKNNQLKVTDAITDASSFAIEIDGATGNATVKAVDEAVTRNWLRYNSSSTLFSCYASGQDDIALYKKGASAPVTKVSLPEAVPAPGGVVSGTELTFTAKNSAKILYNTTSADFAGSWTEYDGANKPTVTGDITYYVKGTADSLTDSDVATFAYTVVSAVSIADARAADGIVSTKGVVTLVDGKSVYIQDDTAGIVVRCDAVPAGAAVGKELLATGSTSEFNGLRQLNATEASVGAEAPLPAAKPLTLAELKGKEETYEAQRVKLSGVTLGAINTGGNTTISSGGDSQVIYKIPSGLDTRIYEGCTVNVTAVVSQYNAYQLRVAGKADVEFVSEPSAVNAPVPTKDDGATADLGEAIKVTCSTPGASIQYNTASATAPDSGWLAVPAGGLVMPDTKGSYTYYLRAVKEGLTTSPVVTVTYIVGQALMTSIREARLQPKDAEVYIQGIIVGDTGNTGGSSAFYVQDGTAGICIHNKLADCGGAKLGDEVAIRATVASAYRGLLQFELVKNGEAIAADAVTVVNANPTQPEPIPVTVAMLNTGLYESRLVSLTGVTLSVNGGTGLQNHTITQNGASATLRANLSEAYAQGATLDFTGVASVFTTPQLLQQKPGADNGVTAGTPDASTIGDPIDRVVYWSMGDKAARPPHPATGGLNQDGAELTISGAKAADGTGRGFNSNGWDNGVDSKYWQIKFSTKGACDITVSATHASSATGPAAFYAMYSVDGVNFKRVPGGYVELGKVDGQTYGQATTDRLPLPTDTYDQEAVYVRWVLARDGQFKDASLSISSGGTSQLNGIIVSGSEYYGPDAVAPVKASPAAGTPVKLGTEVTLTSATAGTTIYYTTDGSEPTAQSNAYTAPIALATLPMTIRAFAVKDGMSCAVKDFPYTQAKVSAVSCNKLDHGAIAPGLDRITFSADKGADVLYRITPNATEPSGSGDWLPYEGPIALTAEQFPVVVEAKGTMEGCIDSDVSVFHFTLNAGEAKNYFGQLHSHTQYSDGAGSLADALDYIQSTAKRNNVQFVAFTDHSNYFDGSEYGGVNPAGALYDMSLAAAGAQARWKSYQDAVADFNAAHGAEILALAGFEMTWSGGPGHINTFNTPGIVSRNNADLNDKSNASKDLGMLNYYDLLSQSEGAASISQFNHPGTTFGTFTDFAYWDPVIDQRMCLVEVGNGEGQIHQGGYYPSYSEYIKALDKGWHVAPTNNQDNHKAHWGDANDARSVIYTNDFSEQGIYQAMKDRRIYATEDKNLEILYTVNGLVMGSRIDEAPETLAIKGVINDPDSTDRISTVELVVNGGHVLKAWEGINASSFTAEATFPKAEILDYSYFFLRVTQADKDIAVTAPVWVGTPILTGINSFTSGTAMPVVGEELTFTTTLFNNEDSPVTLKSISYDIQGGENLSSKTPGTAIPALGTLEDTFSFKPTQAATITVNVTAVITAGSKDLTYSKSLEIKILDPSTMPYIGIDASHYNEYVTGNYKDSMGNFGLLAFSHNVRTVTLNTSADLIAACSNPKYKMLVLTVPSRRDGTALRDPYATYSAEEIAAIAAFAENGGTLILSGWSDLYENYAAFPAEDHMAAQQNKILAALGASLRISDDGVIDKTHNAGGSDSNQARLYFTNYNFDNPLTTGIIWDADHLYEGDGSMYTQSFSQYGGTSLYAVDGQGNPTATLPASVSPIVKSFDTTESVDRDNDGLGGAATPKYDDTLLIAASETLTHANGKTSLLVVSGGAFMSNFEIQASAGDNNSVLGYSNYNILENLIEVVNPPVITTIADVHKAPEGQAFSVEGIVTSNASGYDKDTAFFDCIYLQDETGGINVFPVAGKYQIGQKLRITGTTSSYEGERQLAVEGIKMLNATPVSVAPIPVTTKQAAEGAALGKLIQVQGTITSFAETAGTIQTIMVKDSSGVEARIFIDGYITVSKDAALRENLKVGASITAVGLASYDKSFAGIPNRIRIRDRADIVITPAGGGDQTSGGGSIILPGPQRVQDTAVQDSGDKVTVTLPFATAQFSDAAAAKVIALNATKPVVLSGGGLTVTIPAGVLTQDSDINAMLVNPRTPGNAIRVTAADGSTAILPFARVHGGQAAYRATLPGRYEIVDNAKTFPDVAGGYWAYDAIGFAAANELFNGMGGGSFAPTAPMTRGMLVTVLARLDGATGGAGAAFADVGAGDWYAGAVAWASANHIVEGDGQNFHPNAPVTREQLCTILARYMEYAGITLDASASVEGFSDTGAVSDWAATSVNTALRTGLLNGKPGGIIDPQGQATRAEVAAILLRFVESALK